MHNERHHQAHALFLGQDGAVYQDTLMCSGSVAADLDGQPCLLSGYTLGRGTLYAALLYL
jgi:hypothetical protein